jgi:hypothetical protein
MEETSVTAAAIIHFAENLEDQSIRFYEELAIQFAPHKDRFLSFARESKKNKVLIVRTYQETITDALEACFSFEGLNLQDYAVVGLSTKGRTLGEALKMAIALEEQGIRFYSEVAVGCQSLLGTIPRAFMRVAEGRKKRLAELRGLH